MTLEITSKKNQKFSALGMMAEMIVPRMRNSLSLIWIELPKKQVLIKNSHWNIVTSIPIQNTITNKNCNGKLGHLGSNYAVKFREVIKNYL